MLSVSLMLSTFKKVINECALLPFICTYSLYGYFFSPCVFCHAMRQLLAGLKIQPFSLGQALL